MIFSLLALLGISSSFAQKKKKVKIERSPKQEIQYDNWNYLPSIYSAQLYPIKKESGFPIIDIDSDDQLLLSFDDLRGDVRDLYISMEHCNSNWEPSRLSPLEYGYGFNEERLFDYGSSKATFQAYTNYTFQFPTENLKPKIPGNYILKVYEDADKDRLLLTKRFYAVRNLFQVTSKVTPSMQVSQRNENQKIDVFLKTGLIISNPHQDIKVNVLQNQRQDAQQNLQKPMFVGGNEISYNNSETLDFKGNNEFRYVDLRSFKLGSERVQQISLDSITHITLLADEDHSSSSYASTFDENGRYYIRNMDQRDSNLEGDYAWVKFSLSAPQEVSGKVFIVGGFNNFQPQPEHELTYNKKTQVWEVELFLKQGLYDYEYILQHPNGSIQTDAFSGSFFQTGNDYQILIYHKKIGTFWEELLGFGENQINNR